MSLKNNIVVSKIAILCILTFFFIVIVSSALQLLVIVYPIVGWWYFAAFLSFILFIFLFGSYILLCSGRYMFLFSFVICFISVVGFVFLFIIQKSSIITELITKIIFLSIFLIGLFLERFKLLKNQFIFRLISISASISLLVITFFKPFFYAKVVLFLLYNCSFESLKNSYYNISYRKNNRYFFFKNHIIIYSLIGSMLFSTITIFAIPNYIQINANNSPEIIFWSPTGSLPRSEEELDYCSMHDIGFSVVLRENYISDGGSSEKERIELLLNHSVIVYVVLGGGTDDFYLSTDNGDDFYDIFRTIRSWLILNNLYYYENMRGFLVDAEIPKTYYTDLENKDTLEKGTYFVNQLPGENRMQKIEKTLKDTIEAIHDDDKVMGIIKLPTTFDNLDGDDDYNLLSNTIYSLNLNWDFSVSMNYRTMHIPTVYDYLIKDTSEYDYTSDYEPSYLSKSQLERNIIPISTFYQEISYEIYSSDVRVSQDHRYIFIGTFNKKFEDTSYIKNDEWKKDLDICRSFDCNKVFFYDYPGFERFNSLKSLVKHNEHKQRWLLIIPNYMITRELFASLLIIIFDKMFSI